MIKISEDIKKLYIKDGTPIELEVRFKDNAFPTIKGSDVLSEQMTLHESICEEEQLKFGGCNASSFELTVYDLDSNVKDYEIEPVIITNREEIPLGVFYVDTIEKFAGKDYKKLTAYDKMRYFDVDVKEWYENLTFPISVKDFRDSLCEYIGVEQNETTLIVDNIMLEKNLDSTSGINGLSLMRSICEISGVFGRMDRYGKFDYLSLESSMLLPSDDLYPSNNLYPSAGGGNSENSLNIPSSITYEHPLVEDFFTAYIDGVIIVDSEGAQVITEYNDNPYYINDNFVIIGQTHETIKEIADALLTKIVGVSYRPVNSSKIKGQPYAECGDFISGEIGGYGYEAYIFNRDMTGIKALRDAYTCKGKQYLENDMNGIIASLQRLNKTTEKVKTSVEITEKGLEAEVKRATEAEGELSTKITQTESSISSEVKRATEAEGELSTKITQTESSISSEVKRATEAEGELSSRIEQTEQQIVLRVDSKTGKIVQVFLMGDTGSGTEFRVKADNINLTADDVINLLSGGEINLTGKQISIDSKDYKVTKDGNCFMVSPYLSSSIYMRGIGDIVQDLTQYKKIISSLFISGVFYPVLDGVWYSDTIYGNKYIIDLGDGLGVNTSGTKISLVSYNGSKVIESKFDSQGISTTGMCTLASSPIITSDKDSKKDIEKLKNQEDFIYSLRPVKYRYKSGESNRYHHGFIAQEVKESMGNEDWGVYCDSNIDTGESGGKAIRYEELIADLVATVQSQNERIKKLEEKLGE